MKLLGHLLALLACASLSCNAGRTSGPAASMGYNCYPPWAAECQRSSTGLRRDVSLFESLWPSVQYRVPAKSSENSKETFWKAFSSKEQKDLENVDTGRLTLFEKRDRQQKSGNSKTALLRTQLQRWMERKTQGQMQSQTEKSALSSASAEVVDDINRTTTQDGILTGLYNKGKAFLGKYWAPSNLTTRSRKMSGLVSRLLKNIADKLKDQKRTEVPQARVVQRLLRMIEH